MGEAPTYRPTELNREREALAVVEACIDLEPIARDAMLEQVCSGDIILLEKARHLLRLADAPGSLDTRAPRPWLRQEAPTPERIGRFRVLERIGQGGMGVVVKAVRDDGVYEQTVAIKLMRADISSVAAFERFTQERRILARLNAPSIARILDGGTHEGQPYLVMELIEGQTISDYAAAQSLDGKARIDLFLSVCEAVQAAHRALVVHADIKPSNILVEPGGQVKLVDFGVARLLGDEVFDPLSQGITRAYAALEQRLGKPATVSGDVFALGAVLYELLTGFLPSLRAEGAPTMLGSVDAPTRPAGWPPPSAAPGVSTETARWLAGDLDAIILKATAVDPKDRYADVAGLISDLKRWQSNVPVSARPAPLALRATKFIARHRKGLALTCIAVLGLIIATAISTTLYLRAERARMEATQRFADVRSAARYLLFDLLPRLEKMPGSVTLLAEVADVSQRYLDRLSTTPNAPADVRLEAATGLWRLAQVQAKAGSANLAQPEKAEQNLSAAERIALGLNGPGARKLLAEIHLDQVSLASDVQANETRTRAMLNKARASSQAAAADDALFTARFHMVETIALTWLGDYDAAQLSARAGLAAVPQPRSHKAFLTRTTLLDGLAEAIYYDGRPQEALPIYRELLRLFEAAVQNSPKDPQFYFNRYRARWALGTTLLELGQVNEAIVHLEKSAQEAQVAALRNPDDVEVARSHRVSLSALAQAFAQANRGAEAVSLIETLIRRDLAAWRADQANPRRGRDYVYGLITLSEIHEKSGARAAACQAGRRARTELDRIKALGWFTKLDADYNERRLDKRIALTCKV
jgi:eukaryotic-like serine/threonine-protein kinase